jgi:indolepyruvate ferredoxin oxidoreductase beta subunit
VSEASPIRLSINALGGQGGGVLADWLVATADSCGWLVQATSVPGVAQRTGATVYYLEFCPPDPAGRLPVQALMPVPGDVDIVVAAELMEAGRAIARGLVTPDRTTLIASSHRIFAIAEKSAMGDGITSPARVLDGCRTAARRLVLADYQALAERTGSVISAALFGALAGSGALPFPRTAFEDAIRAGGVGVDSSLRTFADAFDRALAPVEREDAAPLPVVATGLGHLRTLLAQRLPEAVWPTATLGIERLADYQDAAYAALYLDRLSAVADAERQLSPDPDWTLTREAARYLALWMSYEDVIRVADLKTRGSRLARVLVEARGWPEQIVDVTEYMHPRFEELCDTLPWRLGQRLLASDRARRLVAPLLERDRTITTSRLGGFLLLHGIARLRRWRRGTLRYRLEQDRIMGWLASALNAARKDGELAVEIIRCQRLVKGYGDTHARGLHNFATIMRSLPNLVRRPGAATIVRTLREAALKDDEGRALARAVAELDQPASLRAA